MKQSDALKDIISNLYKLFGREAVEAAIVEARTDLAYEEIAKVTVTIPVKFRCDQPNANGVIVPSTLVDNLDAAGTDELSCKFGYADCIFEPAYIKENYPDWYEELGCPTTCEDCENGDRYDDEDK